MDLENLIDDILNGRSGLDDFEIRLPLHHFQKSNSVLNVLTIHLLLVFFLFISFVICRNVHKNFIFRRIEIENVLRGGKVFEKHLSGIVVGEKRIDNYAVVRSRSAKSHKGI